ncbi:MAG: hypothetical protein IT368_04045 [Candidatus Hydrogenedentes bacterium]|nr:hypothetical protein [Candidatus Hydrogenedentota bacterium]
MRLKSFVLIAAFLLIAAWAVAEEAPVMGPDSLYLHSIPVLEGEAAYDYAVAASTLQGVINRDGPKLYLRSPWSHLPDYWLGIFTKPGQWLSEREQRALQTLGDIRALAGDRVKGAVVWDPAVPATVNVATTIAGVEDAVVLSPTLADQYLKDWKLPVIVDLRGKFDGSVSGSAKNDAYRWAVAEYLEKGRCSSEILCLFEDAWTARERGDTLYAVTRDWAVKRRAFVFDLSPWADEVPADDPGQPLGTDKATYEQILQAVYAQAAGKHMTELAGFFAFPKYSNVPGHASRHEPVPTEWETVYLISPCNGYQNTIAHACYNQSLHAHAPVGKLKQGRPEVDARVENKVYLCFLMADYDSATPLYEFLPKHWDDPARGSLPLAWGINPNLMEPYPDVFAHLYATATPNDVFVSDASAAGYMNPNRIRPEHLDLFVRHNKRHFERADMSIAPMVLDWDAPTAAVKDAFVQFAPDGFSTIVLDFHEQGGKAPETHLWKGMPVTELLNHTCNFTSVEQSVREMDAAIGTPALDKPGFYFFRIVWVSPGTVSSIVEAYGAQHPDQAVEVLDPYNWFAKLGRYLEGK